MIELPTGVALNVVERPGAGAPVVCLHGIWDWWRYFRPLVPDGPGGFSGRPLWMLDLRGHGCSSKPDGADAYRLSEYAGDVAALLRLEGVERATLVGHSLGALTALLVAAELPERVVALVLEDPPLPLLAGPSDMFRGVYEMKRQPFRAIVDDFVVWRPWLTLEQAEEVATCLTQTADGVFEATFADASAGIAVPVSGVTLDMPALVIRAGIDDQRALADAGVEQLRAALPRMRVVTIPGASHTVLRDAPGAYRAALAEFANG